MWISDHGSSDGKQEKPKFDIQPNPYDKDYVDITADGKVVLREVLSKDAKAIVDKVKGKPSKEKEVQ